jgi:predicted negative regulator of RcsB-dependent stress response
MAYDLEEEERLAALKAWWQEYGNWIAGGVAALVLALAAYSGWRWYERREAAAASVMYDEFQRALADKQIAHAREVAGGLIEHHGSTEYAVLAALGAAHANVEAGDLAAAKAQLQWVIDRSGRAEFAALARVRLAGILLDEKAYDAALKLLQGDVPANAAVEFADRRGDVLAAQGRNAEARAAYGEALAKAGPQDPLRSLIQLKLDALPAAAAAGAPAAK